MNNVSNQNSNNLNKNLIIKNRQAKLAKFIKTNSKIQVHFRRVKMRIVLKEKEFPINKVKMTTRKH